MNYKSKSRNIRSKILSSVAALAIAASAAGCVKVYVAQPAQDANPAQVYATEVPTFIPTEAPTVETPVVVPTDVKEVPTVAPTLEAIVSDENLLVNGSFTDGKYGWDMRKGLGNDGEKLGKISDSVYKSAPYSLFLPYSSVCDKNKECTRAVWPIDAIALGENDIKTGDVLTFSGYVMLGEHSNDPSVYWVNPKYAGSLEAFAGSGAAEYKKWMDRGGAWLGLDFYNDKGEIISTVREIADWSLDSKNWYELSVCADVVEGAKYAVPWVQVMEKDAPAGVWADDLSLSVIRFR